MGRSQFSTIMILAALVVIVYVTTTTLNQSGAPVDLEVTLKVDYDGTTVGSTVLKYHWLSGSLSRNQETEIIDWQQGTVAATSSTSNSIDSTIKEYMISATQSYSLLAIDEDGHWSATFTILVGGTLPVYLTFYGLDALVTEVTVSSDASLLPSSLKTALINLGVTSIDLIVGWKLVISGDFLKDWFRNLFEFIREGIQTIINESNKFVGSLNL
jgi:hypothetical protein